MSPAQPRLAPPHISIAGACATGTRGSGVGNGSLSTAVVALEMVTGDGELRHTAAGNPDFDGTVLALGALGVVTRLWLKMEPTYEIAQDVVQDLPVATALERLDDILADGHSVSLFSSFRRPDVVDAVWRKRRVAPGESLPPGDTWGGTAACDDVHPIAGLDAAAATTQLGVPGPWHQRLPHFREEFTPSIGDELQSEYFIPRRHARAVLSALLEARVGFAEALPGFEMRTVAADTLWLSPSCGRDAVAVHATWRSDVAAVGPAVSVLEEVVAPFEPRPHWAKVFHTPRPADLYPDAMRFREFASRLDPEGRFVNDFLVSTGVR